MNDIGTCVTCGATDVELNQDEQCAGCARESERENGMDLGMDEE